MYNTDNYIDVLDKLVINYNDTYHSTIKSKPSNPNIEKIKLQMILNLEMLL